MSTVRPIDLLFQDEVRRSVEGAGMYPRATYGVIEPLTQSKPISITIDEGNVIGMPSGQTLPNNSLMNQSMTSGLLGNQLFDPKTFGLLGASAELLKQGGYSTTPRTFGEGLGKAMITGLQNYSALQNAQAKANQPVAVPKDGMLVNPRTGRVVVDARNQGGFSGSGITNQSFNTLLQLNKSVADGTASNQDKLKYRLAYGYLSKPQIVTMNTPDGGTTQIQRPAQDLSGFYNPFPNQQSGSNIIGKKPSPKEAKFIEQKPKLFTMLSNLNKYKITLKNTDFFTRLRGTVGFPQALATKLKTEAEALRLNIKDLEELGALVGGDFQILANRLTNPISAEGLRIGQDGLFVQVENIENQILDKLQEGGFKDATGAFSDPIPANDPKVWKEGRFGLYYKLPDGRIVLKQRKLN